MSTYSRTLPLTTRSLTHWQDAAEFDRSRRGIVQTLVAIGRFRDVQRRTAGRQIGFLTAFLSAQRVAANPFPRPPPSVVVDLRGGGGGGHAAAAARWRASQQRQPSPPLAQGTQEVEVLDQQQLMATSAVVTAMLKLLEHAGDVGRALESAWGRP